MGLGGVNRAVPYSSLKSERRMRSCEAVVEAGP